MVDATDVQGYRDKYDGQMERLDEADIDDRDRDAIERFIVHCRTNDSDIDSLGTVVGHLNRLRLSAERSPTPLVELGSVDDVNAFKLHLEDEHGLSEGTIRNYTKAIRKFLSYRDLDFADDVSVGAPPKRRHDPDDEIDQDELGALLDASANPRDKAMIALLADTGLRIGAVLSLQMQHVDVQGRRATVTINEDANVKGDDGTKPLTWSRGYLANWIDVHPRPGDPDAALIHKLRQWNEDDDAALIQQYAGRIITETAGRAGLDPDRIEARLFRSTTISQWIRDDMGEQAIKHRTGWEKDSRMFEVYSRVTDEEMNDVVFDHYGIDAADGGGESGPPLEECPQCRTPLRGGEAFCPGCAAPISSSASEATDETSSALREFMVEADDADARAAAASAAETAENDPAFASALIDELEKLE
ncbi:tyrosine-type recombinase/integrase [Halococcus saccharolyticus]|uniref:Integrase family protein n=1 Tax=Halococcus saccharolyticus DSM 5350 TaxID=1227455 RepID=M0MA26_9EURY|nr:tyrosine-type recombinase/integrase [Halococcus saccharolyticus]EMA42637.1 integrase family protein [Halococcus saccharolyticus DSM 5350]